MRTGWRFMLVVAFLAVLGAGRAWGTQVSDFALYSAGNVKVEGDVQGDIGSAGGSVRLKGGTITGDVFAARKVKASKRVVVHGTITPLMVPVTGMATVEPSLPALPSGISYQPVKGAQRIKGKFGGRRGDLSLDPGDYGAVKVQGVKLGGTVLLSSGTYHFRSLVARHINFRFDVSKGPVTILIDKKMTLGKDVNVFVARPDGQFLSLQDAGAELAGLVYTQAGKMVRITRSEWAGTLYTPDGKLIVKKSTIDGALYSRRMLAFADSTQTYTPLDLSSPTVWQPGSVPLLPPDSLLDPPAPPNLALMPEPSTLSLLGSLVGGLLLWARRRRRNPSGRP